MISLNLGVHHGCAVRGKEVDTEPLTMEAGKTYYYQVEYKAEYGTPEQPNYQVRKNVSFALLNEDEGQYRVKVSALSIASPGRWRHADSFLAQSLVDCSKRMFLPRLYAILDAPCWPNADAMFKAAEELVAAGCSLIQYRNKKDNAGVMLKQARELRRLFPRDESSRVSEKQPDSGDPSFEKSVRLIMNDRADLCLAAEFDGVHVGQEDLSAEAVRAIIRPDRWLGLSTHTPEQLGEADLTSADYLAIGPVFATASKQNPDPVVGLEGVRLARGLTRKPLVAIGGITRSNAAFVIEAGADSVAVISDLLPDPRKSAEEFFRILR